MIIKYIIGLVVGYITSIILSMPITVLRFGIPTCNNYISEIINIPDNQKEEKDLVILIGLKNLKKAYQTSLLIWIPTIIIITFICLQWLNSVFVGYVIALLLQTPALITNTGFNNNNMQDFKTSLESNVDRLTE